MRKKHFSSIIAIFILHTIAPFSHAKNQSKENFSFTDSSLVAYYPFEGNANDASGNGNNGTIHQAIPIADRFGNPNSAYSFDGVNSYISVPNSTSLNPTNQITITLWVRLRAPSSTWSPIIHKGGTQQNGYTNREYSLWLKGNPFFHLTSAGDGSSEHVVNSSDPQLQQTWIFVAGVINRVSHKMEMYLNGVLDKQSSDSYSTFSLNNFPLMIGWSEEQQSDYSHFNGDMDDIRIYNRSLGSEEIYSLFSSVSSSISVYPNQNALNVNKSVNITATFSQDINYQTLNNSTIKVNGSQSGLHSSEITYNSSSRTATINPNTDFRTGELVSVSLTSGITIASSGVPIVPYGWSFNVGVNDGFGTFMISDSVNENQAGYSIAPFDIDNDGDLDFAVSDYSSNSISVMKNSSNGTFIRTFFLLVAKTRMTFYPAILIVMETWIWLFRKIILPTYPF